MSILTTIRNKIVLLGLGIGVGFMCLAGTICLISAKVSSSNLFVQTAPAQLQSLNLLQEVGLGICVLAMIVLMPLCYLLYRSTIPPLRKVLTRLEDLQKGYLSGRLNFVQQDEAGRIGVALDRFLDSLEQDLITPLQRLSKGDLSILISPRNKQDDLRTPLVQLVTEQNLLKDQLHATGEQIYFTSEQACQSVKSLADGAINAATSLEQMSSCMAEIESQTAHSAANANQASRFSSEAKLAAEAGNQRMEKMIIAMGEINDAGNNINRIIKVIDEIAFQTNLLALNAAVEAARAGQHGKGFAVVAEEVRNLASRSAKAAEETALLIEGSVQKATHGTQIAEQTSEALDEIVESISKVTDLVAEIAAAGSEQALAITQIKQGIGQIDEGVQADTAVGEVSATATEEIRSLSVQLMQMIARRQSTDVSGINRESIQKSCHKHPIVTS